MLCYMLYNALSVGKNPPPKKKVPSPWDFVILPEEDRATTAIGNRHRKIGKDRACSSRDILADRQTDTQTDTHAHHNTSPLLLRAK